MADYDRVYHDSETGASLPSRNCEEAVLFEIMYMREMKVFSRCEHGDVKDSLPKKGDTEHCRDQMEASQH